MPAPLRIAFLCARLDSGGVADYALTVGEALSARGATVLTLDRSGAFPSEALAACDRARIDWIGLHFVSYGWARHGILRRHDIEQLRAACAGRRVALYLHELWIGAAAGEPLKHRLIGALQRRALLRLVAALRPAVVLTSNPVYQALLARDGITSSVIPLPGNLPAPSDADRREARAWLAAHDLGGPNPPDLAAVFGTIHPEWDAAGAVAGWLAHLARAGRSGAVLTLGRHGPSGRPRLDALREKIPGLRLVSAGELPAALLAGLLAECAFGLATSPWALIGKSGTAAAFLDAGLPVLVTRDDWRLRGHTPTPPPVPHPRLWKGSEPSSLDWSAFLASRTTPAPSLPAVADTWLRLIPTVSP